MNIHNIRPKRGLLKRKTDILTDIRWLLMPQNAGRNFTNREITDVFH